MQCTSCQFENMPGVDVCGRCGSPLGLRTLAIDVHPPRAGAWAKRLRRRWLPFRSLYYRAREVGRRRWFEDMEGAELLGTPLGILVRMIVPGWAYIHQGRRARGILFLNIWLVFLALSFLFYYVTLNGVNLLRAPQRVFESIWWGGLSLSGMFLGLAFSVHLASCLSLAHREGIETRQFDLGQQRGLIIVLAGLYLLIGGVFFTIARLIP